jgi:hypothetical protein
MIFQYECSANMTYQIRVDRTHLLIHVIETILATCASSILTSPGKHSEIRVENV